MLLLSSTLYLGAQLKPIFESGKTLLPGTSDPLYLSTRGSALVYYIYNNPLIIASSRSQDGEPIEHLLLYRNNAWEIVIDGRTGMPDGTGVSYINRVHTYNDNMSFVLVSYDSPRDSAILTYDGQRLNYILRSLRQRLGNTFNEYIIENVSIADDNIAISVYRNLAEDYFNYNFKYNIYSISNNRVREIPSFFTTVGSNVRKNYDYFSEYVLYTHNSSKLFFTATNQYDHGYYEDIYFWQSGSVKKLPDYSYLLVNKNKDYDEQRTFPILVNNDNELYFLVFYLSDNSLARGMWTAGIYKLDILNRVSKIFSIADYEDSKFIDRINDIDYIDYDSFIITTNNSFIVCKGGKLEFIEYDMIHGNAYYTNDYIYYVSVAIDENFMHQRNFSKINIKNKEKTVISSYDNFPELTQYFDVEFKIVDEDIIIYDHERIYFCSLDELKNNKPGPFYQFFDPQLQAEPDMHYVHGYEWLYAPEAYWPLVYSFTADLWFYLHGDTGYPLTAYAFGLGWIHSTPEIWPMYYSFERQDWYSFNGQNPE